MERLKAQTQYGDWQGSVAADHADRRDITDALNEKGLIGPGQFLVGLDITVGEAESEPRITALLAYAHSMDEAADVLGREGTVKLRSVQVPMTLNEFFGRFKRFNVVMVRDRLELEGRRFTTD